MAREETLSFAQEATGGPISLSLYVDIGAIPGNQYPASIAVDRVLDVLKRNGDLVLGGKVVGTYYIVYINTYDKMTIHIRIDAMSNPSNVCMSCIVKRMLEAVAKAINARLEDVITATY